MSERKQEIRDYVVRQHNKTWAILQSLGSHQLDTHVYGHGEGEGWTVRELVAHLGEAEGGLLVQAKRVAEGERPLPPDFDIDRWNRSAVRKRKDAPLEEHLSSIEKAHGEALAFLEEIEESKLDNEGVRPGPERITVEGLLRRMVNHRAQHVEDMLRALQGGGSRT